MVKRMSKPTLTDVVEGIKHPEDIQSILHRLLAEVVNRVVGVASVPNAVSTSNKSLQGDIRDKLPQRPQPLPRVLVQEPHSDVERSTTPALEGVRVSERVRGLFGDVDHVDGSQTSGKEGLVRVTPGGVHDKHTRVLAYSLCECLRTMLDDDVPPTLLARQRGVEGRTIVGILAVLELGDDDVILEAWLADLSLDGAAVDSEVAKVGEQLLSTVLTLHKLEQVG